MAQVNVTLHLRKRWFFRPALAVVMILAYLRILTDVDAVVAWMARHTMVFEVRRHG